ncbi:polyamine-transporting ATPase [Sphaerisporangium krabiense]|uniref:Spermidine/putrescine ABC transporter ATP-binding subunit n=1 Tax=Sphaerisporangium krabiense TaxID=763782 RepID=A0A7W8Z3F9_9ACTN|nr:ABC transporter ATP-binding protein [Sphaerisporangium krabiense]MBB5626696.1 spermidine/putrescine ABC transporter ATP-binding subunit [Sphaerisporangium krabiense]GII63615.1 polyamine-transporting ATPase [Sphaerisporangium krabiense]
MSEVSEGVRVVDQVATGGEVQLDGLSKRYGTVEAVRGVSLNIRRGEFLAILGPSGAGKTTLLNMLTGFEKPTTGAIRINGRDVARLAPHKRGIGVVFQHYALFKHMTVAQNVGFPLRMRRMSTREQRGHIQHALELVKLEGYETRFPDQLSGGQQQRVALARAIVFRPALLLMDEPLGALDKRLREHMRVEIKRLQRDLGATVIYVTHDQGEALTMADRVAVMNGGTVEQLGTPTDLYETPVSAFVADFVGETNFFRGRTVAGADGKVGVELDGDRPGHRWEVENASSLQPGREVEVGVRPEQISLQPVESADGPAVPGTVSEVLYEGATALHVVETAIGNLNARLSLKNLRETRWAVGDKVAVHWDARAARGYHPAGQASSPSS